ncbi:MFS transporter [Streptomyces beigongshangae]|uniref:MFS transporter n=1 Tax=Streptomyces beigongshangae TaxID=2841597 RepID=UPI001C847321|nr:MFS transporter [Streptomyces sp. REN17]
MDTQPLLATTAGEPGRHRDGLVLAVCCLAQFMIVVDASVVNVALPSLAAELRFRPESLQWVNNAYAVVLCGFLLLGGRLADLYGRRRVFLGGAVVFTLAGGLGGVATEPVALVIARAFQGLGAAAMAPATLTVLSVTFTEPAARARAFGAWSAVGGSAGTMGVLLGGIITQWLSWRWTLLVNLPLGVLLVAVGRLLPRDERPRQRRAFDLPGAVTATAGLMATVYGIAASHTHGWTSPRVLGALTAGGVLLSLFLVVQRWFARSPLVPLGVFRNRAVASANLVAFFGIAALFSTFYVLTLLLQQVLHYSPLQTGLAYLPLSAGIALAGWRVSAVLPVTGPRPVMLCGLATACAALVWLSRAGADATYGGDLLGPSMLLGLGMGVVLNVTTVVATSGLPQERAGLASGLLNTTRQLGSAVGLVILSTFAASRTGGADGTAVAPEVLASAYGAALLGAAGCAALGFLAALTVPGRPRHAHR